MTQRQVKENIKESITVGFLFDANKERLRLTSVAGDTGFSKEIRDKNVHRPGLALAGYVQLFRFDRVQIFGNTEIRYLEQLTPQGRIEALERIFQFDIPCILVTNDNPVDEDISSIAGRKGIPVFRSPLETTKFIYFLGDFLDDQFSPQCSIHASFVDVYGVGLLLTGRSGIGKSEIALDLIERGHRLVADDVVMITRKGEGILMGAGSELVKHFMEIRGLGLIDVRSMFGIRAIRFQKRVEVVVELMDWNENQEFAAVMDFPTAGPYSSGDDRLIRRHLRMAMDAGLDFFVVNWQVTFQGLNPTELDATRRLFKTVTENGYPLSLAILVAINTEDARVVKIALQTLREEFVSSPAYQKFQNRPVIWYYLSHPFLGYLFQHYRDLVRLNRGCHPIATGPLGYHKFLPRLLKGFFSGWCFYSPLQVGPKRMRESIWKETYRDLVEDGGRIRVFTVCPGYDDSPLTSAQRKGNRYRVIHREGTQTYQKMQKTALELTPPPDFVVVTSFNEFHENTHIEPSSKFGDLYLKSSRAFKEALKR